MYVSGYGGERIAWNHLESVSERLCQRGGSHLGSPDKAPQVRLAMIASASRLQVPFTYYRPIAYLHQSIRDLDPATLQPP